MIAHHLRFALRRLAFLAAVLAILATVGMSLLLFRWAGGRGEPPATRLYLSGDFPSEGPLLTLEHRSDSDSDLERACYRIEVPGTIEEPSADAVEAKQSGPLVCRGRPARVTVGGAILELSIGVRDTPRISIAGLRVRVGDWLGSLADPDADPRPRYPLRAYGIPSLAGQVVACGEEPSAGGLCLEVKDRLGRLAIARPPENGEIADCPLRAGGRYRLLSGDELWLGLVPFRVEIPRGEVADGDKSTWILVLERIDRPRPDSLRAGSGAIPGSGGDRRWLGRLWSVEVPDPSLEVPARFEVFPMRVRYTPYHLSRQRTQLEGEDMLQRVIDEGWLCLEESRPAAPRKVIWRPLHRPGCGSRSDDRTLPAAAVAAYRRVRFGDLSYLSDLLIETTNAAFVEGRELEDATALPLAFDWRLAQGSESMEPQPRAVALWGVRFGATREAPRRSAGLSVMRPEIRPRSSTARHLVQVFDRRGLRASFFLPHSESGRGETGGGNGAGPCGSICLGRHRNGDTQSLGPTAGNHHPLGSVAFTDASQKGSWSESPETACAGCRLVLGLSESAGSNGAPLRVEAEGECGAILPPVAEGEILHLAPGAILSWQGLRLRHAVRSDPPWLAIDDPTTGRRRFSMELSQGAGLLPLLGDESALSGAEAAVREFVDDTGQPEVPDAFELTIDGDLQLAANAIVDQQARKVIGTGEGIRVVVTAVILDAENGDVLAAVNWSPEQPGGGLWGRRPSSWELGSGRAKAMENLAFLRRGAVGSTFKIVGAYALVDNGLAEGAAVPSRRVRGLSAQESWVPHGGQLFLHRAGGFTLPPAARACSTGAHFLPADDQGFTTGTLVRRFAQSCNNFFVLTGLRHAAGTPARLVDAAVVDRDDAHPGELILDARRGDQATLVQPSYDEISLAARLRDGLLADTAKAVPRSLYGLLLRLGFQPRPEPLSASGRTFGVFAFDHGGREVAVTLTDTWFSPLEPATVPTLHPGRDFSYPGIPSPARFDEATSATAPARERYDSEERAVYRHAADGERADVQYAMLTIGQSALEVSALGLATLYAPVARQDGYPVRPCLFRASCGPKRRGPARVLDINGAAVLNQALRAVFSNEPGSTAFMSLREIGLQDLPSRGWGGKTGTYQVARQFWAAELPQDEWFRLLAYACGVAETEPPTLSGSQGRITLAAARLVAGGPGAALGARACEAAGRPLNPAGIHRYRKGELPALLDELAALLQNRRPRGPEPAVYHSFVAVAPPARGGWPTPPSPAQGLVVAVLVDRETPTDPRLAVKIGGELAAAADRWARIVRKQGGRG